MDENDLRTDYWVDNRSNKQYPLWLVFKQIGHELGVMDDEPYVRQSRRHVSQLLKTMEQTSEFIRMAGILGITEDELRAMIWYLIWLVERQEIPIEWSEWNRRIDAAWQSGVLKPTTTR